MKAIDPELLIAVEFGYRQLEKGRSLQFALEEFKRLRLKLGRGHKLQRRSPRMDERCAFWISQPPAHRCAHRPKKGSQFCRHHQVVQLQGDCQS